jgi:ribosomal protein S18 acetylase RimI-like enzyme
MAEIGDIRLAAYLADGFLSRESGYARVLHGLGAAGTGRVLVAVDGDRILGTVMLQFWPEAGEVVHGPEEAEIRALAVAPSAQRMGAGNALLQAVVAEAAASGVRYLALCTLPAMRTAHRMYERAGFVRLPERDWSPQPGSSLLAYGMPLGSPVPDSEMPDRGAPDRGAPDSQVPGQVNS